MSSTSVMETSSITETISSMNDLSSSIETISESLLTTSEPSLTSTSTSESLSTTVISMTSTRQLTDVLMSSNIAVSSTNNQIVVTSTNTISPTVVDVPNTTSLLVSMGAIVSLVVPVIIILICIIICIAVKYKKTKQQQVNIKNNTLIVKIDTETNPSYDTINIPEGIYMDTTPQLSNEENRVNMTEPSIEENIAYGFNMMTAVEDTYDFI